MNKEQKAAVVEEVATQIKESEAVFAVDYRGISVPQAAELRERLNEAGARFRVVKNTLTIRAADQAGADDLKGLLEGPTAFTFVAPESGDVALAAKALDRFRREHDMLAFKGGRMGGEVLSVEQLLDLAKLPARDVLHGQLVGVIASPITGLVRGLNQLIAGFASQLQQMVDQGLVGQEEEAAPEEAPAEADQDAQQEEAAKEAEDSAGEEGEGGEPSTEAEEPASETEQEDEAEAPSEGETEEKEG
ncbi:MAG: 50S ribosomal protein L10 [Thermoleophilaceae bacterium]